MTQEEKELLLKDLSARLPYGVNMKTCHCKLKETLKTHMDINHLIDIGWLPYLRPMSSMTEEEKHELYQVFQECPTIIKTFPAYAEFFIYADIINSIDMVNVIDWLNSHHFDYRGLIQKGLAIDCTNLNIY
jgi:hypothetical protein